MLWYSADRTSSQQLRDTTLAPLACKFCPMAAILSSSIRTSLSVRSPVTPSPRLGSMVRTSEALRIRYLEEPLLVDADPSRKLSLSAVRMTILGFGCWACASGGPHATPVRTTATAPRLHHQRRTTIESRMLGSLLGKGVSVRTRDLPCHACRVLPPLDVLLYAERPGAVYKTWLLLDFRVVDWPRSSNRIVVTLSSLLPLFFKGLFKALT